MLYYLSAVPLFKMNMNRCLYFVKRREKDEFKFSK